MAISAAGQLARLVIIVSGLSDEELRMSEKEMSIIGLILQVLLSPSSDEYGYLILLRGNCGANENRHRYYIEEI